MSLQHALQIDHAYLHLSCLLSFHAYVWFCLFSFKINQIYSCIKYECILGYCGKKVSFGLPLPPLSSAHHLLHFCDFNPSLSQAYLLTSICACVTKHFHLMSIDVDKYGKKKEEGWGMVYDAGRHRD